VLCCCLQLGQTLFKGKQEWEFFWLRFLIL
jgi:hypothetical protein